MGTTCDLSDLPSDYSREVISDIIDKEDYTSAQVVVASGSEKGDNYLGNLLRIKITGIRSNGLEESTHLMMKLAPVDEKFRELVPVDSFYRKEVYSYSVILPFFDKLQDDYNIPQNDRFKVAKCYKASSEKNKELIVMGDLSVEGFKMYDRLKSFDTAHLKLSIENLARIHAFSFVIKSKYPQLFAEMAANASNSIDFGDMYEEFMDRSIVEALKCVDDELCQERLRNFTVGHYEKMRKYLEPELAAPYNVICHGDSWSNNLLFKYEDNNTPVEIRTLDWQVIRNTSPVTDLAYLICHATDEITREQNFPAILDFYYDTLRSRLTAMAHDVEECYPQEVYRDHIKTILPYGLMFGIGALPVMLSERGNAPDVVDMLQKENLSVENRVLSKSCIDRMRGLVRDFIKYDLI